MRAVTIVALLSLAALASGYVTAGNKLKYADKVFLQKQKTILHLLKFVHQPEAHPQYYQDGLLYKIEENYALYTNPAAVKEFVKLYSQQYLQKDDVFTILNEKHRNYAVALFHALYYAKDWETFYKTMVWANVNANTGAFIYALTVAVVHRPDMVGMELPAPYELYPYYFFNSETIQKAQLAKMRGFAGMKKVEGLYNIIIPSNYSNVYYNEEQKISYFTEDIGLNTYYYYFHTDYPFWMGGKEFNLYKDRRGELFLFQHQQLLARYYLERLSNDLGKIPELSYNYPVKTGYYPNLRYYNGQFFPIRDNNFNFYNEYNYYDIGQIEDYERRIRDAIDYGYVSLPDGTQIDLTKPQSVEQLGKLIQGNPDMPNKQYFKYVEVYARLLLGSTIEQYDQPKMMPSALEHFETSMRDPLFYMLYKRLIKYYWQYKNHLVPYTRDELLFQGVKIVSADVDKLITYFDKYDSDITNAVDIEVPEMNYVLPIQKLPVQQFPYQEVPVEQIPYQQVPYQQVPVKQVPYQQVPVRQVPYEQVPVHQVPVQQVLSQQVEQVVPQGHIGIAKGGYSQANWVPGHVGGLNVDWTESGYEGIPQPQVPQVNPYNLPFSQQPFTPVPPTKSKQQPFVVKARQWRLNHVPFTLKLSVLSDKPVKSVVRAYIGPKYDENGNILNVNENRQNFWLLDVFPVDLVAGQNMIIRNSRNFTWYVKDRTPFYELSNWVDNAYSGLTKFPLDLTEAHCGFPQRLMIPKGKKSGQAYQIFFIITPFVAPEIEQGSNYNSYINCGIGSGARYLDALPMGYPFDRKIDETNWYTPNMYYVDTMIYNRKEVEAYSQY